MSCELYVLDHFRPITVLSYKDQLKNFLEGFLSEDDYADFIECLTNYDLYENLEGEMKSFVDSYYREDTPIEYFLDFEKEKDGKSNFDN